VTEPRFPQLRAFLFLFWMLPQLAQAHSLGIDPADLSEQAPGQYVLNAKVPPQLQSAITTPILPDRCGFVDGPAGIASPSGIRFDFTCQPGLSAEDVILLPWSREGVLLTVTWADGSGATRLIANTGETMDIALDEFKAGSSGFIDAARRYTLLGIEHILLGVDHLLFVLALMIMVGGGWRLVKTITAFTLAHSLTLALATLGYLSVPAAPVEATIALSIVYICVEIVHASQGRLGLTYTYPWIVSFTFGLLHGLGFAGALSDIGLPTADVPTALLFFNIGVELGQLLFVAAAFATLAALNRLNLKFSNALRFVPVYVIGAVSTFWFLQRAGAMIF
jgi:hypothetical protein